MRCGSWGRKESDTTEQLNWLTELMAERKEELKSLSMMVKGESEKSWHKT